MSDSHGRFVWYELMTSDTRAAKAFYGDVMGWVAQDASMPDLDYTLLMVGETHVGGLMTLPEGARAMGLPPNWTGYIAVDDVDASAAKAKSLGGRVHVEPKDIPEVGRFAVVADPQGAMFALFKTSRPGEDSPAAMSAPGHVGWHELAAADWEKAFAFYSELFGWRKSEAHDMGEMGTYQLFARGDQAIGGMFTKPPSVPAPFWLFYTNIADFDAATERVKAGGGKILNGPMQVPGGSWIVQCADPQGAVFALVGTRA